jgi:replicative superfamily II helicase
VKLLRLRCDSLPHLPPSLNEPYLQMLIVTPEKWDVITRKSQLNDENFSKVQLLIIDEVHLLHDDRGPVIETIVARALRHAEIK